LALFIPLAPKLHVAYNKNERSKQPGANLEVENRWYRKTIEKIRRPKPKEPVLFSEGIPYFQMQTEAFL
jgi:hypothetical protein